MGLRGKQTYKVKLASGRVLGPLDLERIRLLILKNQITGTEVAREYPQGEWVNINQIAPIADLLVARASGSLAQMSKISRVMTETVVLPGATQVLPTLQFQELPESQTEVASTQRSTTLLEEDHPDDPDHPDHLEEEKTVMATLEPEASDRPESPIEESEKTRVASVEEASPQEFEIELPVRNIAQEKTVVFQRSSDSLRLPGKKRPGLKEILRAVAIAILLGILGHDFLLDDEPKKIAGKVEPIRPTLPHHVEGKSDPKESQRLYNQAFRNFYILDTVEGYKEAAKGFLASASKDVTNVQALAMLASSYLNLIDSSNKDENYFSVISKLIDMSRAKAVDLPQTVFADVEFYLVVNKAEAAENRVVEYTTTHKPFEIEMFYYLALAFLNRGDPAKAAKYISNLPDKTYTARFSYLKGQIAEKLQDQNAAFREYEKAIQINSTHAKSRLRLAYLLNKQGKLKEAAPHLEFLMKNPHLLPPKELGEAYYHHALLAELYNKRAIALGDVERAVKLDPENHDYLLELYTLRAGEGDSGDFVKQQARMYFYLGEGEKLVKSGRYQEALVPFLQARQVNDKSPLPLIKIGDMFDYLHDIENAKNNYKLAADRAPNSIQVWSKYIKSLIQSFEWEEASKAMDRFRKLPVSQSAIDKAAADMYEKQGRHVEAQTFYKKAMARDVIDPEVYIAYAKSLMSTRNYKEAPFFFALALRFDPLNVEAIINTAKCVAETESIDRAISMLEDELRRSSSARAEFVAAIAEFQIQKGDWERAQINVDQAMRANPDYAYSWKLQAQIYMNREHIEKDALDKALQAYKSYSERNASDPSGYLERYKIFVKKTEFEKAKDELSRIYTIYPKYPKLHFYLGVLYGVQGNHKVAAEEFKRELTNNPNHVETMLALGRELIEVNQAQLALDQFSQAMQLAPQSADAKQNAGWANYYLKNYMAAVTLLRAALIIDKANPTIYKRLGTVYRDMGDMASACSAFKKYLQMEPDAPDKATFQSCL